MAIFSAEVKIEKPSLLKDAVRVIQYNPVITYF